MWDLATMRHRNIAAAERQLASAGQLAPRRPRAGAKGHCAECGRDVAREPWDGDCSRCEPAED